MRSRRSSGPESNMKWVVHPAVFENRVLEWIHILESNREVPPLIINYEGDEFEVNCNNPLLEALHRMQITDFPTIIWHSCKEDYESFNNKFTSYVGKD